METCSERRKRKLIDLAAQKGGTATIAKDCKLNPATLDQIVKGVLLPEKADGTRSERSLGDDAARKIEARYGLERGWFDSEVASGAITGETLSEPDALDAALEVLSKALAELDEEARSSVGHSLSRLAQDPSKLSNISQIIRALVFTNAEKSHATDTRSKGQRLPDLPRGIGPEDGEDLRVSSPAQRGQQK